jgi:hypothetical protein
LSTSQEILNQILAERDAAAGGKPSTPAAPASPSGAQPSAAGKVVRDVAQGVRDLPSAVWRGVTGAINEGVDTVNDAFNYFGLPNGYIQVGGNEDGSFLKWYSEARKNAQTVGDALIPEQSSSTTGKLIESATQFGVGMLGLGKIAKVTKIPGAVSTVGKLAQAAVKGGIVDATFFDSYSQRLSNIIQEHPSLQNPVTEFLAGEGDGDAVRRLKAGLEGTLTGVALESFTQGLRILKKTRLLSNPKSKLDADALSKELQSAMDEAQEIVNQSEKTAKFKVVETPEGLKIKGPDGELSPNTFQNSSTAHAEAATLNMLETEKAIPHPAKIKLTDEEGELVREAVRKVVDSADPEALLQMTRRTDLNYPVTFKSTLETSKAFMKGLSEVMEDEIQKHRGLDVLSYDKLTALAKNFFTGEDPDLLVSTLAKLHTDTKEMAVTMMAGFAELTRIGGRIAKLSAMVDGNPDDVIAMDQLARSLDHLMEVQSYVKGTSTSIGRSLQVHQNDASKFLEDVIALPNPAQATTQTAKEVAKSGPEMFAARMQRAALQGMTPDQMKKLARRIRLADGDPNKVMAVLKSAHRELEGLKKDPTLLDFHNEYWFNALLSGPQTHEVNFISNLANAFVTPAERFTAGIISWDKKLVQEGVDLVIGNVTSFLDSVKAGAKALKIGKNILDSEETIFDARQGYLGGYLGSLIRIPSRFLMSADEFAKQLSYRSNIRAQALREAREQGLTPDKVGQYVTDALQAAFNPEGKGLNKAAMAYAQENTYTNALDPKSVAGGLANIVKNNPYLRLIMPFTKVPANLAYWTWERTPVLRKANSHVREELAAGGQRAAIMNAKLGTGLGLYSTGAALALSGMVTGNGPGDKNLRTQWLQSHKPYSIRTGPGPNDWVSYRRLDPFMMPIGIVADFVTMSGELHSDHLDEAASAFMAATAANLTSKTYLQGIVQTLEAFTSRDPSRAEGWTSRMIASEVPAIVNQTNPDDSMRELRGWADTLMGRLPGFSETLPPRRNLFGEPVMKAPGDLTRPFNPFTVAPHVKGDGVLEDKLIELGKALPMPNPFAPGTEGNNAIDLRSHEYGMRGDLTPFDRMLELTANPGNGNPTLRQQLSDLVMSDQWDQMSPGTDVYPGGMRLKLASDIVQGARQRAYTQVLQEFPRLREAIQQESIRKNVAKTQGQSGVSYLESLFKGNPK